MSPTVIISLKWSRGVRFDEFLPFQMNLCRERRKTLPFGESRLLRSQRRKRECRRRSRLGRVLLRLRTCIIGRSIFAVRQQRPSPRANATSPRFGPLRQQRRCLPQQAGSRCLGAVRQRMPAMCRRLEPRPLSRRWRGLATGNLSAEWETPDFRCCIPRRRSSFE